MVGSGAAGSLTARSPAKLILSGEHAVVYGHPALAVAVNRYAQTRAWHRPADDHYSFDFTNLKYTVERTARALKILKSRVFGHYVDFLKGERGIREVLQKPFELLQFAVAHLLEGVEIDLPRGLAIRTDSTIPTGCGMGSSAAAVMSLLYALAHLLHLKWTENQYLQLGQDAENLQHGYSSGLDLRLALLGGCIWFEGGQSCSGVIPKIPLYMINTGQPVVTTGECVVSVARYFKHSDLGEDFGAVTCALRDAFSDNNAAAIVGAIRENHRLLSRIDVVPERVAVLIHRIEALGGAAKVCGAGSIAGQSAGIVLAACSDPIALSAIAGEMGYQVECFEIDHRGAHVV
jgi:mevalonate kinase